MPSLDGRRTVFVLGVLRPYLEPLLVGRAADALVFGGGPDVPFDSQGVARKAGRAWDTVDEARKETAEETAEETMPGPLDRFTLHEARHSFSTWMDHAGISGDRADRYMGHSSGSVASRYRHLLAKQRDEDRATLDTYLAASLARKVVQLRGVGLSAAPAAASPAAGAVSA